MNTRQNAIMRARARAYVKQQTLRASLHELVDATAEIDPAAAYAAWTSKEIEVDRLVKWLVAQKEPPSECAGVLAWLTRNPALAFAAYNAYIERKGRELAAVVGTHLDEGVSKIAGAMVNELQGGA